MEKELLILSQNNKSTLEIISLLNEFNVPYTETYKPDFSEPKLMTLNLDYTLKGANEIKNYIKNFYNKN